MSLEDQHTDLKSLRTVTPKSPAWEALTELVNLSVVILEGVRNGAHCRLTLEKKYQEIIAAYNQDKDRATVEDTFAKLIDLANSLSAEQRRAVGEGLSEEQLALFDLLQRDDLTKVDRERINDLREVRYLKWP
jgi:type I restriction enzyme R subunit